MGKNGSSGIPWKRQLNHFSIVTASKVVIDDLLDFQWLSYFFDLNKTVDMSSAYIGYSSAEDLLGFMTKFCKAQIPKARSLICLKILNLIWGDMIVLQRDFKNWILKPRHFQITILLEVL